LVQKRKKKEEKKKKRRKEHWAWAWAWEGAAAFEQASESSLTGSKGLACGIIGSASFYFMSSLHNSTTLY